MLNKIGSAGFKRETTPGTAETIAAANIGLIIDPKIDLNPGLQERKLAREVADDPYPVKGGITGKFTGALQLRGSGTPGTAPPILGDWLLAGGFLESLKSDRVDYTLDPTLSAGKSMTAKEFKDGKYRTLRGVRGNCKIKLEASKVTNVNFDGEGVFQAQGDGAVLATPSENPIPYPFEVADMWLLQHHALAFELQNDSLIKLRSAAATDLKLSVYSVQSATGQVVRKVRIPLKKLGTPTGFTNGIWMTIEGDSTGDPDGVPITHGTSNYIDPTTLSTDQEWVDFDFPLEPTLVGLAKNHFVLNGDYTESAVNCVEVQTDTCLIGAQVCKTFGVAWAALSLKNVSIMILVVPASPAKLFWKGADIDPGMGHFMCPDPNSTEGFIYAKHNSRKITIGLDPFEVLEAQRSFWNELVNTDLYWCANSGAVAGNIWQFRATHCKIVKAGTWGNQNELVSHPITLHVDNGVNFTMASK